MNNPFRLTRAVAIWAFAVATVAANPPSHIPPPECVNIGIIDTSGSMAGARLATAKQELKTKLQQLPPSDRSVWIFIPFHSEAYAVREFRSGADEAITWLDALSADGGTCIAAGLKQGIEKLPPFRQARHLVLHLYTDGEDSNPKAIAEQQAILDKLFHERKEDGLANTVICKRWGSSNADLVARFRQGGNAQVFDAGEARLLHLTFDPEAKLAGVSWHEGRELKIEINVEVQVHGNAPPTGLAPLQFSCTDAAATGDRQIPVTAGEPARKIQLVLPCDPAQNPKTLHLAFQVDKPAAPPKLSSAVLVATLSRDLIDIEIPVPPLPRHAELSATAVASHVRWTDPLTRAAEAEVVVTINADSELQLPFLAPATVTLEIAAPLAAVEMPPSISIAAPGTQDVRLKVAFTATDPMDGLVHLELGTTPDMLTFEPTVPLEVSFELIPPPPVITNIAIESASMVRAEWIDLERNWSAHEGKVTVVVDGPIPLGIPLEIQATSPVLKVVCSPATLKPGRQQLRIAALALQDKTSTLSATVPVKPPQPHAAVEFQVKGPLTLRLAVPRSAQLVLFNSQSSTPNKVLTIPPGEASLPITLMPTVRGVLSKKVLGQLPLRLSVADQRAAEARLLQPLRVDLPAETSKPQAFFHDTVQHVALRLDPALPTPHVLSTTETITLRREAPFRRLLFVAATIGFIFTIAGLAVRLVWRIALTTEDLQHTC